MRNNVRADLRLDGILRSTHGEPNVRQMFVEIFAIGIGRAESQLMINSHLVIKSGFSNSPISTTLAPGLPRRIPIAFGADIGARCVEIRARQAMSPISDRVAVRIAPGRESGKE